MLLLMPFCLASTDTPIVSVEARQKGIRSSMRQRKTSGERSR